VQQKLPAPVAARFENRAFAPPPRGAPPPVRAALDDAAVHAFRIAMLVTAALVALGGALSAVGIENPRRAVPSESCPGGAAVGASRDPAVAAGTS
jgi:hypothetical protein